MTSASADCSSETGNCSQKQWTQLTLKLLVYLRRFSKWTTYAHVVKYIIMCNKMTQRNNYYKTRQHPLRLVLPSDEYSRKLILSHWKCIKGVKNWGKIGEWKKSERLFLGPHSTPPENFIIICYNFLRHFAHRHTHSQTDTQTATKTLPRIIMLSLCIGTKYYHYLKCFSTKKPRYW